MSDRNYGQPRTESEREMRHAVLYPDQPVPPRGTGQSNMGLLNRIANMIGTGLIKFVNLVFLANRDLPYHDYHTVADGAEPNMYVVGENNRGTGRSQKKTFVSKSTLIMATAATTIRLNNTNNVTITLVANTWYEFKSNITAVYTVAIGTDGNIYIYTEGVLPQEGRSPE